MTPEDSISVLIAKLVDDKRAAEARAAKAEAERDAARAAYIRFYRKVQDYAVNRTKSNELSAIVADDRHVFYNMFPLPDEDE